MIEVILAITVLMPFGWRWWLVASAVPTAFFLVFCYVSGTTPRPKSSVASVYTGRTLAVYTVH